VTMAFEPTPLNFERRGSIIDVVRQHTPVGMRFLGRRDGEIRVVAREAHVAVRMLLADCRQIPSEAVGRRKNG
jgi:hypothetical protein